MLNLLIATTGKEINSDVTALEKVKMTLKKEMIH